MFPHFKSTFPKFKGQDPKKIFGLVDERIVNLIMKFLVFDREKRMSVLEALKDPIFDKFN